MKYRDQLRSPKWQRRRLEIMERDRWACQSCGSTEKTLAVHHFEYIDGQKAWEAPDHLLVTVCEDCHTRAATLEFMDWSLAVWQRWRDAQNPGRPRRPGLRQPGGRGMNSTLALDLGTTTGWALSPTESGIVKLQPGRYESAGMRFVRFRQWLDSLPAIQIVVYEEVRRHKGVDAAHVYGGLLATLQAWCIERHVEYSTLTVGQIKQHATGKGNANKDAMVEAARSRGWEPVDDNHADALFILDAWNAKQGAAA